MYMLDMLAFAISHIPLLLVAGPNLSGENVCKMMREHKVTAAVGVPTVFSAMLQHLEETREKMPPTLKGIKIGGSAMPLSMLQAFKRSGVDALHAWGGYAFLSPHGIHMASACWRLDGMDH